MYTKAELEKLTVLQLRKVAKETGTKLGAGVDKAGIVEKILSGQESEAVPKPQSETVQSQSSFLSFDVTSVPKSAPKRPEEAEKPRPRTAPVGSRIARPAAKPGFRGNAQPAVRRFGPQAKVQPEEAYDEPKADAETAESKPKDAPVTADGYRLGYQAQAPKGFGHEDGGYHSKYPYSQRSITPPAAEDHFHDDVYLMSRNIEFDQQVMENQLPDMMTYHEGENCEGKLEIMPDGYGFLRTAGDKPDVYVSQAQIRRFDLKTDDVLAGKSLLVLENDPYPTLLYVEGLNGKDVKETESQPSFDQLDAIYPTKRVPLEAAGVKNPFVRLMDLVTPIGYGQRGMLLAPPDSGSLVAMKNIAMAIQKNDPAAEIFMLLIDLPPEEITLMKEAVRAEIFAASFADAPETQTRVSEAMLERAQKAAMAGKNTVILLDSMNKLVKAYQNQVYQGNRPIGNTVTPSALIRPKRLFGMAKNTKDAGSLTVIATMQVDTGSRVDDIICEEFKGTANMMLYLCSPTPDDVIAPMIDIQKSFTRREELLLTPKQQDGIKTIRGMLVGEPNESAVAQLLDMIKKSKNNDDMFERLKGWMAFLGKQ